MIAPITLHLIDQIEALSELDNRYTNLKCCNIKPSGKRIGVLSVVFTAKDKLEDRDVIIKFIDPDRLGDQYRLAAFRREPEILRGLLSKNRGLQLIERTSDYPFDTSISGAMGLVIPIPYFVTEYIPNSVEGYFVDQDQHDAVLKLGVFRQAMLAVKTIHYLDEPIHHRDIKPDNMLARDEGVVVLIDFGTAARFDTKQLKGIGPYSRPVGAPVYAAPEAHLGFSGNRDIAYLNDIYALGCMLFELFHHDIFARHLGLPYAFALTALGAKLAAAKTDAEKRAVWEAEAPSILHSLSRPRIDSLGHSIPDSIMFLIKRVYDRFVQYDFNQREPNLDLSIRNIDSAIVALNNGLWQERELELKRERRARHQEKVEAKEARLERFLSRRAALGC